MMTGKELRGKTEAIQDILTDIEWFLQKTKKLDLKLEDIINRMKVDCEDLFYLIPLDKEK